jgi:cobalt-zinc-cadmium efflux system outer membrane protein
MRTRYLFGAVLLLPTLLCAQDLPPVPASLESVLRDTSEKNPDIQAARRKWRAAAARVPGVASWPDPLLFYSREKTPSDDQMSRLRLEQDIPFPGKKSLEGRLAHHEARIAESRYLAASLDALSQARILYFRLNRAEHLTDEYASDVAAVRSALASARARWTSSSGDSAGRELFSLSAELGRLENRLFEEKQERLLAAAELNTLLDRDVETPPPAVAVPGLRDLPVPLAELRRLARENDPLYLEALHEVNHARAMRTRSRLAFTPDFRVMYERQRAAGGETGYEAGVGVFLPLWLRRPAAEAREASEHLEEAEAMSRAARNEVEKMTVLEFTETVTHLNKARQLDSVVLPAAEGAFRIAQSGYESGRTTFLDFMEALRGLLEARSEYHEEIYHYGEHWALLERWVGVPLESISPEKEKSDEK